MTRSADLSRLRGSIVALVTPFKDGKVDEKALADLVSWHIAQGTHGIVPVGTTGESPTLSSDEHCRVVDIVVEAAAGRVPIIAGAGSNNTEEAIHYLKHAETAGADAALVVTPYYNKPTQEGIFRHFEALSNASDLPIITYNIPGRSVVEISVETMGRLATLPSIVGVKDATANLARIALERNACGPDFVFLSGEDPTALGYNATGGQGCISVTANVVPGLVAKFQTATLEGDFAKAREIDLKLAPLHRALFLEASPAPVKWALGQMGKCSDEVRLPLVQITEPTKDAIRLAFAGLGLTI